jgi:uncharacterized protein (TIGR03118 family)
MTLASRFRKSLAIAALGLGALCAATWRADAGPYVQTNLVSDIPGLAKLTEPTMVNPWGISHSSTSPFWISDQGTNLTNLWAVTGQTNVSKQTAVNPPTGDIAIPTFGGGPAQGPTGQVNNGNTSSFLLGGTNARFIFSNLNGTISAWNGGSSATIVAEPLTGVPTVYTGLAINTAQTQLYAANNAGTTGSIDVFNSSFQRVTTPGAFATPAAVSALNLVPFNVQDIGGKVYVTYAPSGLTAQRNADSGKGAVVVFDENGNFLQTLILGSELASPWGVALAPAGFGEFADDLLVGNFSFLNSEINAFDPTTGALLGTIPIDDGGNGAGGLWALNFGIGGSNGDPNTLYFTDGIAGETHGLFAALTPAVPEPSTLILLAGAFALLGLSRASFRH